MSGLQPWSTHERDDEKNKKDDEQNFSDDGRRAGNTAKTESCSNQGDDEK